VAWRRQRRHDRFRLVLAVPVGLAAVAAALAWAGAEMGATTFPAWRWALLGAAAVLGVGALALRPRPDPDRWARGAAGERATAEILRRLPARRWVVLHDLALTDSRTNVDHLVIGPTGVWVVDTKAYRARVRARWGRVLVGGVPLSTAAVRWEARVVSDVLGVDVRPVIAVHARGLRRRGRRWEGVTVVPAGRLPRRLSRGRILRPALDGRRVRELGELATARFW
jgi:Nuclease-related domain